MLCNIPFILTRGVMCHFHAPLCAVLLRYAPFCYAAHRRITPKKTPKRRFDKQLRRFDTCESKSKKSMCRNTPKYAARFYDFLQIFINNSKNSINLRFYLRRIAPKCAELRRNHYAAIRLRRFAPDVLLVFHNILV